MKQGFVIHHNGPNTNLSGKPHSSCEAYWNGVRRFHMESKGWSDIAYSFGICHHGERFVGRGWNRNQFANGDDIVGVDNGPDADWYTVLVFLGWNANNDNPVDEEPSASMVDGVSDLIEEGRSTNRCGTRVLPHNAFKPKRCPGATFTRLAGQWDRAPLSIPGEDDMTPEQDQRLERVEVLAEQALAIAKFNNWQLEGNDAAALAAGRRSSIRELLKSIDGVSSDPAGDNVDTDAILAAIKALPAQTVTAIKAAL